MRLSETFINLLKLKMKEKWISKTYIILKKLLKNYLIKLLNKNLDTNYRN